MRDVIKALGWMLCGVVLTVLLYWPSGLFGQGPSGFTKINGASVTTTTFVDNAVVRATTYQYAVTAVNAAGESSVSNVVTGQVPDNGNPHSATLTWNASTGATGYNIYRFLLQVPAAPTGLAVATN